MKKQFITLSYTLLLLSLMLNSCKKDNNSIQEESDDLQMTTMSAPQFRYYEFGVDITENDFLKKIIIFYKFATILNLQS